jgi:hypothetical protein
MDDYALRSKGAQKAIDALFESIFADLDDVRGGIGWWYGHLDQARVIFASDYLVSVVAQAAAELKTAAFHEEQFAKAWNQEQIWLRMQESKKIEHPFMNRNSLDARRETQIDTSLDSFFYACGSVLDKLTAAAIGVLAIRTDIVKASWSLIAKCIAEPAKATRRLAPSGTPARQLQDDGITAIWSASQAGPADWLTWMLDYRHTLIHRAPRILLRRILPRTRRQQLEYVIQLPRHPQLTDAEALVLGRDSPDLWLREHAVVTAKGILDSLGGLVETAATALVAAWEARRRDPSLLQMPDAQWKSLYPQQRGLSQFTGFGEPLPDISEFMINPRDGRRLSAAQVFDSHKASWVQRLISP